MPHEISRNPISGHTPAPSAFDYVDTATSTNERVTQQGAELKSFSTDKVGINQRHNGHWKVGSFHVANFFSLGIIGYVGKLCANSSRMGSQKSGWFTDMVKDYGQTYLNATQDSGKVINTLTKGWSEGLGSVATLGMGPLGRLIQNSSHNKAVNQAFGNAMQREFGAQRNYNVVRDLNQNTVQQAEKELYRNLNAEVSFEKPETGQGSDYTTGTGRMVAYTGSDSLKAAFLKYATQFGSAENALFYQWSSPTLDKLDPTSSNHDPDYTLSKKELLALQQNFVIPEAKYGSNLKAATIGGLGPELTRSPGNYQQRLENAQQQVKLNPNSAQAQQNLQDIENERLSIDASQALLPHLKNADHDISSTIEDVFMRFSTHINEKANELGVAPQLEQQVMSTNSELQTEYQSTLQNNPNVFAIDTGQAKPEDVQQLYDWLGQHKNQQICAKPNNSGGWDFYVDRGKTASKEDRLNVAKPLMQIGKSVMTQNLQRNLEKLDAEIEKLDKESNDRSTYYMPDKDGKPTTRLRQRIDGRTQVGDVVRLRQLKQNRTAINSDLQTLQQSATNVMDIRGIEGAVQQAFINAVPNNWTPPPHIMAQGIVDPDVLSQAVIDHVSNNQGLTGEQLRNVVGQVFGGD
ncbi:MAG: hypothetical protein R3F37_06110 [Candidatus Competibacteraceae bacterium]